MEDKYTPSNIEKAVVELYKIVGLNHVTPDIVATANFMLKDYEEDRKMRYVRHLQEEAETAYSNGYRNGVFHTLDEVEGKFHDACNSHEGNPTGLQIAAQVQLALNELRNYYPAAPKTL